MALGDENLGPHDVEAGNNFRDRMLNLDTRVHLDEEPFVAIEIVEKLHRARVVIFDGSGEIGGGFTELPHDVFRQAITRGDFDDLLVTPLHGAVPLVEVDYVTVFVAKNLHLDVLCVLDILFEKHRRITKRALSFALCLVEQGFELGGGFDDAHTATAAAEGRFDDERKTYLFGDLLSLCTVGNGILGPRQDGHADLLGHGAGGSFVAHIVEELWPRADPDDTRLFTSTGEGGVLGEKPVAGVDGIDALFLGDPDHTFDVEVGGHRTLAGADLVGLIRFEAMDAKPVFLGEHGDGAQIEFGAGSEDAHGDFRAVGRHEFGDRTDSGRGGSRRSHGEIERFSAVKGLGRDRIGISEPQSGKDFRTF